MNVNQYITQLIQAVEEKHNEKPEFIQAVKEFLPTIEPYLSEHPEIIEKNLLPLMIEPERVIQFRVPWQDDKGKWQVNLAFRVQYNSALGPYKGGIRFDPSVNESIMRFLGFEQTFKNALTHLPLGGGKGGSDFNPSDKSDDEVMRFTQSFMTELQKYIGPDRDVPAGDIGVGKQEIGYMYGQYKRLNQTEPGAITGKPVSSWGSLGREEATGNGLLYFVNSILKDRGETIEGKRVVISGKGNVAYNAAKKAQEFGATVIAMSDRTGYIYNDEGLDLTLIEEVKENDASFGDIDTSKHTVTFSNDESVFNLDLPFDIALPCATQNEIYKPEAENIVKQGVKLVAEGANMPCDDEAISHFFENNIIFAPGKAANAGGVAVSGFEMAQNAMRLQWTEEAVDENLQETMRNIYTLVSETAEQYATKDNLQAGANIAGFARVAEVMLQQGLV